MWASVIVVITPSISRMIGCFISVEEAHDEVTQQVSGKEGPVTVLTNSWNGRGVVEPVVDAVDPHSAGIVQKVDWDSSKPVSTKQSVPMGSIQLSDDTEMTVETDFIN
jgi:hypothetical protein